MGKRLAACAAALCLFFFYGCSDGEKAWKAEDLDFTFSCHADVICSGEKYTCSVERAGPQTASVEILSGGAAGLAWYWNGKGLVQTYAGLADESASSLPEGAFASVLVRALDAAARNGALTAAGENEFSGSTEGFSFSLSADPKTGFPSSLDVSSRNLKVRFYNFDTPVPAGEALDAYAPD